MRNLFGKRSRRSSIRLDYEPRYTHGDRHATTISIATVKGGVGKTTTAVNLAVGFAQQGQRVLLIDLDAQGHCSTCLTPPEDTPPPTSSMSEVLLASGNEVLDAFVPSGIDNLLITPADPTLAEAEGRISQKIGKEMLLHDALAITRTHFDLILIDCPPNKGNLTLNALRASDYVLIPTDLSPLAIQGADELLDTLHTINARLGASLQLLGVLLTRYDGRNATINTPLLEELQDAWGELLLETRIAINIDLAKAQLQGQSIFDFAPRSRGAQSYRALLDEIADRLS